MLPFTSMDFVLGHKHGGWLLALLGDCDFLIDGHLQLGSLDF
jgi:hypothetical protein